MKTVLLTLLCASALATTTHAADVPSFKSRLLAATTKHLNFLLDADGSVGALKGKTTEGQSAMGFYFTFEVTRDERYRRAALTLADRV